MRRSLPTAPRLPQVARQALPLSSPRCGARSAGSGGTSSGLELVTLGPLTVSVVDVLPTQRFVNLPTFTTPDGLTNIFDVMVDLLDLSNSGLFPHTLKDVPPWPPIRVARRKPSRGEASADASADADGDGGSIFSIDNRRLFMLKVLGVSTVEVEEIEWMREFDSKLKQGNPPAGDMHSHCPTNDEGVLQARRRLDATVKSHILDAKFGADEDALLLEMKELNCRHTALADQLKQVRAERARLACGRGEVSAEDS